MRALKITRLDLLKARLGADRPWLLVMAATVLVELAWWGEARRAGIAPAPFVITYLLLASAGLAAALALRAALRPGAGRCGWPSLAIGTALTGIGASLFLPLKYAIPREVPFWLDAPLASAERALFGAQPWQYLVDALGWAMVPIDRIYGLWLPVQSLILFLVMIEPPSRAKSRALIAYGLAWFVLGVAAATILSSAGPLFYDRLFGGTEFAGMRETLRARAAWAALAESDAMWASLASARPGLVAGISAVPSLHVAISLWIWLTARTMAPNAARFALIYAIYIWIASVALGWHYASDGLAGVAGMVAIWWAAGRVERALTRADPEESENSTPRDRR